MDGFYEDALKGIEDLLKHSTDAILQGRVSDMEEYRYLVGRREALEASRAAVSSAWKRYVEGG